ncbi:damaged DNA binding exodeoxyribonuclease IIIs [Euphorbia peplus]|nr:damaged DNA binding exodeoxyribonuclease IIIs [Euphorbia peplus]
MGVSCCHNTCSVQTDTSTSTTGESTGDRSPTRTTEDSTGDRSRRRTTEDSTGDRSRISTIEDRYKYKFIRATTSNIPSSVIIDNRGTKYNIWFQLHDHQCQIRMSILLAISNLVALLLSSSL